MTGVRRQLNGSTDRKQETTTGQGGRSMESHKTNATVENTYQGPVCQEAMVSGLITHDVMAKDPNKCLSCTSIHGHGPGAGELRLWLTEDRQAGIEARGFSQPHVASGTAA